MRHARETETIFNDGEPVGILLKPGFCAEHEWGIKPLQQICRIKTNKLGIPGRTISNPDAVRLLRGNKGAYLCVLRSFRSHDEARELEWLESHSELRTYRDDIPMSGAWDEESFCVFASTNEAIAILELIHQHAKKCDLVICLSGPSSPFDRDGLVLQIVSKIPKEIKDKVYAQDRDYVDLQKAGNKTKIVEQLKAKFIPAHIHVHARPEWTKNLTKATRGSVPIAETTKYPVVYWINMQSYCGWYTVEELKEWIETGSGIVEQDRLDREVKYQKL